LFAFNAISPVTTASDMVIYNTQLVYLDEENSTETNTVEFEINNSVPVHTLPYRKRDKRSPFPGRPPATVDRDSNPIITQEFNYSYTGLFSDGSTLSPVCLHPWCVTRVSTG
jgi:hypothetical protein